MWHDWQLRCSALKALCCHSWKFICSGSEPTTSPLGPNACVISVWHVAHSSDCLMCGASACTKPVTERMIVLRPASIGVGAEDDAGAAGRRRLHHEAAVEALARAEPVGRDLVAHRARHAVSRQAMQLGAVLAGDGQVREHLAVAAGRLGDRAATSACDTWRTRPGSPPTCVGWSIVSRRTAACQYGSRAELAIIVERQVAPIETSSPAGVRRLLWQATQFSECVKSERSR